MGIIDFKGIDKLIKSARNGKRCAEALNASGSISEWLQLNGQQLDAKEKEMLNERIEKLRRYGLSLFSEEYQRLMCD